jgi:heterodisulfide reductase subunit A
MHSGELHEIEVDVVVLATWRETARGTAEMCEMMSLERDEYGFISTSVVEPSRTSVDGIFVCGMASGPRDVPDTVASGGEAASRCMEYVKESASS